MQQDAQGQRKFVMSSSELKRRQKAFDRLMGTLVVAATICSVDLLVSHLPGSVLAVVVLLLIFVAARTVLASSLARFALTTWAISGAELIRADDRSRREYRLDGVCQVRAKRTTAGRIREIKLNLENGASVYVNGLEDFEEFWESLKSTASSAMVIERREPLDFDHPSFYVVLGATLGAVIAVLVRIMSATPQLRGQWVYALLAGYSFAFGAYWLYAKPVAGRYGARAVIWDITFSVSVIALGVGAALAVILG